MDNCNIIPFGQQQIRIITDGNGEPWFYAVDVCAALGIVNSRDALSKLDADEKSQIIDPHSLYKINKINIINETGLFRLVSRCRSKAAKNLQKTILSNITLSKERILNLFADLDIENYDEYFVYAIQECETGHIKIGISKDPERRVKQLQTANSQELRLLHYVPAPNRFQDEQLAHTQTPNHIRGEWFDCGVEKAVNVIEYVTKESHR
ncbi:hypothetical protein CKO12_09970 [Chromatium okenii]|uniref:BRO family protein n=1 Tax=Chromatium okenii TaxID=61644 RepID=UPI001903D892|nr:BRO family protein [Chromatium okenii]MBK1642199.1 hypothetical protein [Chromatium okenii]